MHDSRRVFLLDPEPRCILATYEPEGLAPYDSKKERKEFKTFDETIVVDDFIVVPTDTRHKMTIMKVVEVDVDPDLESSKKVDWVVAKTSNSVYQDLLAQESKILDLVNAAKKKRLKAQMKADFLEGLEDEELSMMKLAAPVAPGTTSAIGTTDDTAS